MKTQHYIVAEHHFSITLQQQLFNLLDRSFQPFAVDNNTCCPEEPALLFSLTQVDDLSESLQSYNFQKNQTVGDENEEMTLTYACEPSGLHLLTIAYRQEPPCCTALCQADFSNVEFTLYGQENHQLFALNNLIMMLYALASAPKGTLMFHASVIMNQGKAYLFLGKSGTGKSTHSSLWLKYIAGSELLNDDNPIVRVDGPDGPAIVYGSPWSGKTPCYKPQHAPIGGIVKLSQAPYNKIQKLPMLHAYATISPTVSNMRWHRPVADGIHASINALIQAIPVYALQCLPDEEAARLCHSAVTSR